MHPLNKTLSKIGIQIKSYPDNDLKRRMKLIKHFEINKIFDVGANIGDYAITMRELGFTGEIVSFETLSKTYHILTRNSRNDNKWKAVNIALGSKNEELFINIAANSDSSSILEMLPEHINSAPKSAYIGKERIVVKSIDAIFNNYCGLDDRILLKIDTQGFEKEVLDGAIQSLSKLVGIQLEMSIIPLYKGEMLYLEMISFLESNGFVLFSIENGFSNPDTGRLLQADGIFFRVG